MQSIFKCQPDFDKVVDGILKKDSQAQILFVHCKETKFSQVFLDRLKKTVGDNMDRVMFVDRQYADGYMNLLTLADVMLDSFNFGGGATSLDAFAVDLPIITWPGTHLKGRTTYACYEVMGISDAVAGSAEEYVELAVKYATDKEANKDLREKIAKAKDVLYENVEAMHELEACLVSLARGEYEPNPGK